MALATSGAVHIRLLGSPPARPRLRLAVRRRPLPPQNAGMMAR
jgi:hypothetical protein